MNLHSYLGALRKHVLVIVLTAALGVAGGYVVYARTPPQYASTLSFYVSTPLPDGSNAQSAGQFAQSRVNSYILLLTSDELARRVLLNSRVALIPREVASKISADSSVGTVLIKVQVTDTDRDRAQAIAEGLTRAFPEMVDQLDNNGRKTAVVVINTVSGPTTPTYPIAPDLWLMLLAGLAAGLVAGVLYAVGRELLDTSIRTPDSARHVTRVPVLGVIPLDPNGRRASLALPDASTSRRSESYRKLRTNIRFLGATEAAKTVIITSAAAGDGKTVTALNLALTLAEMGERVLFMDADLRRPKAAEYLDVSGQVGLSNVLAGEVPVEDALQPWGSDDLTFLAAGSLPPNPSELLGSHQMRQLMTVLGKQYDRIIIDTPPVLPVTDAVVAAAYADIVVLVIRAGRTTRAQVNIAVDALRAASASLAGTVLNAHREAARENRYTSYYPSKRVDRDLSDKRSDADMSEEYADANSSHERLDNALPEEHAHANSSHERLDNALPEEHAHANSSHERLDNALPEEHAHANSSHERLDNALPEEHAHANSSHERLDNALPEEHAHANSSHERLDNALPEEHAHANSSYERLDNALPEEHAHANSSHERLDNALPEEHAHANSSHERLDNALPEEHAHANSSHERLDNALPEEHAHANSSHERLDNALPEEHAHANSSHERLDNALPEEHAHANSSHERLDNALPEEHAHANSSHERLDNALPEEHAHANSSHERLDNASEPEYASLGRGSWRLPPWIASASVSANPAHPVPPPPSASREPGAAVSNGNGKASAKGATEAKPKDRTR